ncbi:MAG: hypothetical protein ACYC7A_19325 [Thermoanaerobaculia bacterium]
MFSQAEYWLNGKRRFTVVHNASRGIYDLSITGELPPNLVDVPQQYKAEQDSAGGKAATVDYVFEVPVVLAERIVGYRYNETSDDEEWVVLAPDAKAARSAGRVGCLPGASLIRLLY